MNQFSLLPVVSVDRGRPVASSLDVASYFGKRHDHVLRDIRGLLRTEPNGKGGLPKSGESLKSFARLNFVLGTYRNVQNKEHPHIPYDQEWFCASRDGLFRAEGA